MFQETQKLRIWVKIHVFNKLGCKSFTGSLTGYFAWLLYQICLPCISQKPLLFAWIRFPLLPFTSVLLWLVGITVENNTDTITVLFFPLSMIIVLPGKLNTCVIMRNN